MSRQIRFDSVVSKSRSVDEEEQWDRKLPMNYVSAQGREEYEAILKDAKKCEQLGLDQQYEITMYLKRWGGWLDVG